MAKGKGTKTLIIAGTLMTLVLGAKQLFGQVSNKIGHSLKFRIPLDKLKFKTSILKTNIEATLQVDNHTYISALVENLHATILFKNDNGEFVNIGDTAPSPTKYMIKETSRNTISLPAFTIDHASLFFSIKPIITALQQKQNKILIKVSGYVNGIPFETVQQY